MIKSELVERVAKKNPHLYHRDAERIVQTILSTIVDTLANGERVELRGFGAFSIKQRHARKGRNPITGETVAVQAKRVAYFKTSAVLHEKLNTPARRNSYTLDCGEHQIEN